jgi:flavin-dependent dehydrogenase
MPRVVTVDEFWSDFYLKELNQFAKNEGLDVMVVEERPKPTLATANGMGVRELELEELKSDLVEQTNALMEREGYDIRIRVDADGDIRTYRVPKIVAMNGGGQG